MLQLEERASTTGCTVRVVSRIAVGAQNAEMLTETGLGKAVAERRWDCLAAGGGQRRGVG